MATAAVFNYCYSTVHCCYGNHAVGCKPISKLLVVVN